MALAAVGDGASGAGRMAPAGLAADWLAAGGFCGLGPGLGFGTLCAEVASGGSGTCALHACPCLHEAGKRLVTYHSKRVIRKRKARGVGKK